MPELKPIVAPEEASRRIAEKKGFTPKQEPAAEKPIQPAQPASQLKPEVKPESKPNPFDIEGFNKFFGTQHKSVDEIKSYFDADKKFKDTEEKYNKLTKDFTDLKAKSQTNPFADSFVEKLNEMKKAGASNDQINAFVKLNSMDINGMDSRQKAILKYQLSDGLTEREATRLFNKEYKLDSSHYPDLSEDEIQERIEDENIRLKRDSKGIDSFLSDYVKKVSTVENPEQVFASKWKEYEPKVRDFASTIADSYEGIKMNLNGKKGDEAIEFGFQVPEDFKKEIPNIIREYHLSEFAKGSPVPMTQDGVRQTKEYVTRVLKAEFFDKYMLDGANHVESLITQKMANKYTSSGKVKGDQAPAPDEPKDTRSQYKQNVLRPRHSGITMS